ncbi:4-hydroxyphenylpyruvate dioxygenase [Calothrix sp. 336/3]|uniref:4-hydroxyphenylpyruvate dioxygenase n=1 Tax=Calothrix sp. 336/3 TaxID=1337936 RepID=UPI0004E338F4|nr:4-hydroxyphenylpyruvate dioxygenase [Calothrix sp. 336/3]AKG24171.1 4-hydroxyphenylpyruvate dioxygenase [Calothrix sp. 336/3]
MKIAHIHFYVDDAHLWANWFVQYLNFSRVDNYPRYFSLPWEEIHTKTEVVCSGSVYFLLSSPVSPQSRVAEYLSHHPAGIADVAFVVENLEAAIARAEKHGAKILQPIQQYQQHHTCIHWCKIAAWGSLTHTLIEYATPLENITPIPSSAVNSIDHIVLNVPAGELNSAVDWYEKVLDFYPQQVFNIQTKRSALHSRVMLSSCGTVQFPINQPATPNSQIQEFLDLNRGAGVQHIALHTQNMIRAIAQFRSQGLPFLSVPPTYYSQLAQRPQLPLSPEEIRAIAQQEILVDWNTNKPEAILLQIFTQPIFPQPTFFLEFIERRYQAQGFGEGNFQALFEAMEREQMKRGTL